MPTPATLCIFTVPPLPTSPSLPLARDLGVRDAAALATAMLLDTISLCRRVETEARRPVSTALAVAELHPFYRTLAPELPRWPQGAGSYGMRLEHTLRYALTQRPHVAIVSTETPHLLSRHMVAALDRLSECDFVVAPSDKGGVCLLAARVHVPGLLAKIDWMTGAVFLAVCEQLAKHRLSFAVLEPTFKIASGAEIERARTVLEISPERAPQTARALRRTASVAVAV